MPITQIPPGTGSPGPKGDSGNFTYYAYATDNAGAGFTLTPDNNHKYFQILVSATEIGSPAVGDFTGVWVKYIGDNGTNGSNGANAYTYYAYASDSSGGDFTTTFDANLAYVAVRSTTTPLTPVVDDFAGRWVRYIGQNGVNGTNGVDGIPGIGDLFRFSTALSGDPTAGFIRMSDIGSTTNQIDLVTKLYIDFFAQGGLDVSAFQTTYQVGGRITIKSQASSNQKYGIWSIDSVANQTSHRVYTCSYVAGSAGVSFSANELLAVSYVDVPVGEGAVTSADVLAADDFARFYIETGVITGFKDGNDNKLIGINPEIAWSTLAGLVATLPKWSSAILAPTDIGGSYRTSGTPIRMVTNNTDFRPECGRQLTHHGANIAGLATASGSSATKFNIPTSPSFPANFFKVGMGLRVIAIFEKSDADTTVSNFSVRFGKLDSTGSEIIGTESTSSVHTNKQLKIDTQFTFTAIGAAGVAKILTNSLGANSGGGETAAVIERNAQVDTTVVQYLVCTAHCAANAAATHNLLYLYVELIG